MRLELKIQFNTLTFLLAINLALFLIANVLLSISSTGNQYPLLSLLGGYDFFKVTAGELWLLITSGFLHFQLFHFIINMYSLFRLGSIVSQIYSDKILYGVYIFGALGGSLLTLLVSLIELFFTSSSVNYFSVGASSAIFALIGLLLGGTLRKSRYGFDFPFSFSDILPVIIFSLLIGLIPGSNINNWAHLGGLIIGVVMGLIISHAGGFRTGLSNFFEKSMYNIAVVIGGFSFFALIANFILTIFK